MLPRGMLVALCRSTAGIWGATGATTRGAISVTGRAKTPHNCQQMTHSAAAISGCCVNLHVQGSACRGKSPDRLL